MHHCITNKVHSLCLLLVLSRVLNQKSLISASIDQLGFGCPFISNDQSSSTINIWSSKFISSSSRLWIDQIRVLTEDSTPLTFGSGHDLIAWSMISRSQIQWLDLISGLKTSPIPWLINSGRFESSDKKSTVQTSQTLTFLVNFGIQNF